ncbi:MAG: OmpA family protein [Flavobacteriaceae bacterium]|jgi:chemotaxis protein MotB|nr:OmpA family protein [Flavobacteriaceae bacterium]
MNRIFLGITTAMLVASCVPQAKYKELEKKYYAALQGESKGKKNLEELENQLKNLQEQQDALAQKKAELDAQYQNLQAEYDAKAKNLEELQKKNDLLAKDSELQQKEILGKLKDTQGELQQKINRINELENLINQQKTAVSSLKSKLQNALKGYEGKGISVEEKDGYIYISMENKLLFPSGSWEVESEGKNALHQLSAVLKQDNSLKIIVQGNTDTDKYASSVTSQVKDNWDLSVMRGSAITKILQLEGVTPIQMTASGRGEYFPVTSNSSSEGKSKNRRVDIIISPNLEEINKLLNEL